MWDQIVVGVVVAVVAAGVLYGVKCLWVAWHRKTPGTNEAQERPSSPSVRDPSGALSALLAEVSRIILRHSVSWAAERDSGPTNTDDGKHIIERLGDELVDCRVSLQGQVSEEAVAEIDRLITETRAIQKHQVYLDGGKSFREFWQRGDRILAQMTDVVSEMRGV